MVCLGWRPAAVGNGPHGWTGPGNCKKLLTLSVAGASGELSHDGGRTIAEIQEHRGRQALEPSSGCVRPADARPRVRGAQPAARGAVDDHGARLRGGAAGDAAARAAASSSPASARAAMSARRSPRRSPRPARPPFSSIRRKPRHGDLGMITRRRRAPGPLLVGRDGRTRRHHHLFAPLPRAADRHHLARRSALGQHADIVLVLPRIKEACPHGLAPTPRRRCSSRSATPRHRAARSARLHRTISRSSIPAAARRQPAVRRRHHAQRRRHAARPRGEPMGGALVDMTREEFGCLGSSTPRAGSSASSPTAICAVTWARTREGAHRRHHDRASRRPRRRRCWPRRRSR